MLGVALFVIGMSAQAREVSTIRCGIQGPVIVRLNDGTIIEYKATKTSVRYPDWLTRVTFDIKEFKDGSTRIKFFTNDAQKGNNYNVAIFNTTGLQTGTLKWERRTPWGYRKTKTYRCTF